MKINKTKLILYSILIIAFRFAFPDLTINYNKKTEIEPSPHYQIEVLREDGYISENYDHTEFVPISNCSYCGGGNVLTKYGKKTHKENCKYVLQSKHPLMYLKNKGAKSAH